MIRGKLPVGTFTIRADGPDGRVDHFYAATDLVELEVVPAQALAEALEFAADGWAYADEYFIEKWGAKEEMERLRAILNRSATPGSDDD